MSIHAEPVIALFRARAAAAPDRPRFAFADEQGRVCASLTDGELLGRAESIAGWLTTAAGLARGDRALLAYPPSLDFVEALVGCLLAGVVPVPVAPPNPFTLAYDLTRFAMQASHSGARCVLSNQEYTGLKLLGAAARQAPEPGWPDLPWYTTDQLRPGEYAPPPYLPQQPDDLALLQYTSGSTSFPKGVMMTHGNLAHQLALNAAELAQDAGSRAVLWVPHFHDFGLISGVLSAVRGNAHLTMFSPLSFLARPALWMELLSREGATHTAAPDFAYELVVRKTTPAERARWDLRRLRVAMSAAEPVRADVVRAFCEAFAPCGFRREAFCPAYGLAEHTVGVSMGGRGQLVVGPSRTLVGCGSPSAGVRVRIVDPRTRTALQPGEEGEIWVDSPSKAAGYLGLPEESQATFRATLVGDEEAEYLRTGDLGFLHDGELYITGRRKDLVIIRGRNVYPADIESSLRGCHEALRPGGVVAFSIEAGGGDGQGPEERLVVLVEVRKEGLPPAEADALAQAVRRRVLEHHGIDCHAVAIALPGAVLKTTSGKLRRQDCRQGFLDGSLKGLLHTVRFAAGSEEPAGGPGAAMGAAASAALAAALVQAIRDTGAPAAQRPGLVRWLQAVFAAELQLGAAPLAPEVDLLGLGIDSLASTRLYQRLCAETGIDLPATLLLDAPTLGALAGLIGDEIAGSRAGAVADGGEAALVARLSDDDAEALLARLLTEEEQQRR